MARFAVCLAAVGALLGVAGQARAAVIVENTYFQDVDADTSAGPFSQTRAVSLPGGGSWYATAEDWDDTNAGIGPGSGDPPATNAPFFDALPNQSVQVGDLLTFVVGAQDIDDDRMTLAVNGIPQAASFPLNPEGVALANGTFSWTPIEGDEGTYLVTFFAIDENVGTNEETITIDVTPIPEPSTLIVWSLLGALGITVGWWRRRRAVGA